MRRAGGRARGLAGWPQAQVLPDSPVGLPGGRSLLPVSLAGSSELLSTSSPHPTHRGLGGHSEGLGRPGRSGDVTAAVSFTAVGVPWVAGGRG